VSPALHPAVAPTSAAGRRPLRVLHLIDNLGMGGAEAWLVELMRYWDAHGGAVRSDFVATGGRRGVFDDEATALGARIHYLHYGRASLPSFVTDFRRVLREGGYDALHDHQDYASGWHYLIGAGRLPPVRVTHVHNPAYQKRHNQGVTFSRRLAGQAGKALAAHYATHVVGTSREAIAAWGFDDPAFASTPRAALYCGLDPRRFQGGAGAREAMRAEFGWPADSAIVLFAGRFDVSADVGHPQNHKNSGFATAVAIACALADSRVRFVFAGPFSPATPILRQRIEAAGVSDRIVFAGVQKDIGRLMSGSSALFFPSRAEGLGMVAVEAQAAGTPVLASDTVPRECVVIPELVRFLGLDAGVEVWRDALLDIVRRPLIDPAEANRRVAASPYAIANSAAALEALYAGVLPT
jgi:glycosyltransferase involved in cell wall biosynthesis